MGPISDAAFFFGIGSLLGLFIGLFGSLLLFVAST
jgi:hypothetical protein